VDREDAFELRYALTVLKPISQNAEGESFRFSYGLLTTNPIRENARQIYDLADPSTIIFTLELNGEITHEDIVARSG
jgi:hypothetical protein